MSSYAIFLQKETMDRIKAAYPGTSRWGSFRLNPMAQLQPKDLPCIAVYIVREQRNPDSQANMAEPRFLHRLTLGISAAVAVDTGKLQLMPDVEQWLADLDDLLLSDGTWVQLSEGVEQMDRQSQIAKQGETTLYEIRVEMILSFRSYWPPRVLDDLLRVHLETRYPDGADENDGIMQVKADYDLEAAPAVEDIDPPVNTIAPAITGTPQEGELLTLSNGTWARSPTSFARQWQTAANTGGASLELIDGATSNTFTPTINEVGLYVRARLTAGNAGGSGIAYSNWVGPIAAADIVLPDPPVNTVAPVASGTAQEGQAIALSNGTWTNSPTGYAKQYQVADDNTGTNLADIGGATSSPFTVQTGQVGKYIRGRVVASNAGGSGSAAFSNWIGPIAPALSPTTWDPATATPRMVLSNGNLTAASQHTGTSVWCNVLTTTPVPTSGKKYYRMTFAQATSGFCAVGFASDAGANAGNDYLGHDTHGVAFFTGGTVFFNNNNLGSVAPYGNGDTVWCVIDDAANKVWFSVGASPPDTTTGGFSIAGMPSPRYGRVSLNDQLADVGTVSFATAGTPPVGGYTAL